MGLTIEQIAGCTQFAVTLRDDTGTTRAVGLDRVAIVDNAVTGDLTLEIQHD
jgi:hypothetical protein